MGSLGSAKDIDQYNSSEARFGKCESNSDLSQEILQQWPTLKSFVFVGTILKEISARRSETSGMRRSFSTSQSPVRMNSFKPTKLSSLHAALSSAPSPGETNQPITSKAPWSST